MAVMNERENRQTLVADGELFSVAIEESSRRSSEA